MIVITEQQLKDLGACQEGINWFNEHKISELRPLTEALIKDGKTSYLNWLLPRLMTHPQKVLWAIYSAEKTVKIFEKKYPKDKRPRLAIKAAKDFLKGKISIDAANAAANAAYDAANVAANAAYAAANAANAAYAAANAAYAAANAAANAAYAAAKKKTIQQITNYALKLLGE